MPLQKCLLSSASCAELSFSAVSGLPCNLRHDARSGPAAACCCDRSRDIKQRAGCMLWCSFDPALPGWWRGGRQALRGGRCGAGAWPGQARLVPLTGRLAGSCRSFVRGAIDRSAPCSRCVQTARRRSQQPAERSRAGRRGSSGRQRRMGCNPAPAPPSSPGLLPNPHAAAAAAPAPLQHSSRRIAWVDQARAPARADG